MNIGFFSLNFLDPNKEIGQWTIMSLDTFSGYKAAVAIEGYLMGITEHKIDPDFYVKSGSII